MNIVLQNETNQPTQTVDLGTYPLKYLMPRMALPSIIAQIVNILYTMVDRIFIGHMNGNDTLALTGIGICMPIIMLLSAFSNFAGMGGAPLAAIELGKQNKKEAEKILRNSFSILTFFSITLTILIFIFKRQLLIFFGASSNTIQFADDYLSFYLLGTIFSFFSVGLNSFISAQGNSTTAMLSVIIGAVLNLILDPIFIFVLNLGVKGSALATIVSQLASAIWVISFLCSKKATLTLKFDDKLFSFSVIKRISALGISPFIMASTGSAMMIVFNSSLQTYGGDLHVGAMTIMQSIMQMALIPVQGFAAGVQPIISYNYGAKNMQRVKKTVISMTIITGGCAGICALVITLFPKIFGMIFTSDESTIELIGNVLPIYIGGMWFFGLQMSAQNVFIGMEKAKTSLFIALLRKVILIIPLTIILPQFFGVTSIYWTEPISSTISAITASFILVVCMKKLRQKA